MTRARLLARVLASAACAAIAAATTACAPAAAPVTECAVTGSEAECERHESFVLADAEIVVDELTTNTETGAEGTNKGWITADLAVDGSPTEPLSARLHIIDPADAHETVYEPEDPDGVLAQGGDGAVSWDFSGTPYPATIAVGVLLPNVYVVLSDGTTEITVHVIESEVS